MSEMKLDDMVLNISDEIHVDAPLDVTFEALLEQLGPGTSTPDGKSLDLKVEAWPGGRWYRDLGGDNGHYWATVKAIVRPTLLEFVGPMAASYPVAGNIQYRLKEEAGGTLITFRHLAFGQIPANAKEQMTMGWGMINGGVKKIAEGK